MKRDSRGRFAQTWSQETKRSHRLSLTSEAWQLLEQRASELGISRSEVVEQYARSLQNIDEQKRLEGSLQEELEKYQKQQARLEAVLNFLPIPLMLVELETGLFPFSNRAATEMAGQPLPDDMPAGTYNTDQLIAGFLTWVNLSESSCLPGLLGSVAKMAQAVLV